MRTNISIFVYLHKRVTLRTYITRRTNCVIIDVKPINITLDVNAINEDSLEPGKRNAIGEREREREIAFGQNANEERKRKRKVRSRANIRIARLKSKITNHTLQSVKDINKDIETK